MGKRLIPRFHLVLLLCLSLQPLLAQTASPAAAPATSTDANARIAKLEQQVADAKSSADNGWMLTSSALVLMMTGPGLALFYGGMGGEEKRVGNLTAKVAFIDGVQRA